MNLMRLFKHLLLPDWWVRRGFDSSTLNRIETAIRASETCHDGELRFVVEAGVPWGSLLARESTRARALNLFSQLGVWDTEHNSGVLIYVQLIDRRVEIVADRGINNRVMPDCWSAICRRMEAAFRDNRYADGATVAVDEITALLAQHFPPGLENKNELPDRPLLL